MKKLLDTTLLLGIGFGVGFLYSEIKAGRTFKWESEDGSIKFSIGPNVEETNALEDTMDEISDTISSLNN